jgi:hypothetical protein
MPSDDPPNAAAYARRHAGERDAELSDEQRDLLGRVVAKRMERGDKLTAIARAAAGALLGVETARAERLGRDAALQAIAWEQLRDLRHAGTETIGISPTHDACPACRASHGEYAASDAPPIPIAGCSHPLGCRCIYVAGAELPPLAEPETSEEHDGKPTRPWYRPRPPRPHPPRWSEERKEAARNRRPQNASKPRKHQPRPK